MKAILGGFKEALAELRQVNSCCAGSDRFIARTIPLMIKQNETIIKLLSKPPKSKKRKLSAYQRFCQEYLLQGYTLKQVAGAWSKAKAKV
jgi:hypothetical protein